MTQSASAQLSEQEFPSSILGDFNVCFDFPLIRVAIQYRSEISGQRTRKTHAQFLRKRVLKNVCRHVHLRAFDARVSFCYSLV